MQGASACCCIRVCYKLGWCLWLSRDRKGTAGRCSSCWPGIKQGQGLLPQSDSGTTGRLCGSLPGTSLGPNPPPPPSTAVPHHSPRTSAFQTVPGDTGGTGPAYSGLYSSNDQPAGIRPVRLLTKMLTEALNSLQERSSSGEGGGDCVRVAKPCQEPEDQQPDCHCCRQQGSFALSPICLVALRRGHIEASLAGDIRRRRGGGMQSHRRRGPGRSDLPGQGVLNRSLGRWVRRLARQSQLAVQCGNNAQHQAQACPGQRRH